jgi:uncharacterized membrane protein
MLRPSRQDVALGSEDNMTPNAARRRKPCYWMGVIGMALQGIAFFIHARTAGLVLQFIGLGLVFWSLKMHYDNSESRNTGYQLIPRD